MKLRVGYLISGIATGLVLLAGFLTSLPDGNLHIVFCAVGQGDAAYIRFADGRDMLIDGGPDNKVIDCLGRHMPFWDRSLDLVVLTHPQKDHMQGLIEVVKRFRVGRFARSDVAHTSEGYAKLQEAIQSRGVAVKFVEQGEQVNIGEARISVLWPSGEQLARADSSNLAVEEGTINVLGAAVGDLNDFSVVFHLRYGTFDAIFTGDADTRVEGSYRGVPLAPDPIEVLKVPHHGSRTGMSEAYLDWISPRLAVISVGKNNYGHPAPEILSMLSARSILTRRTDAAGDVEVVTDGQGWSVED
jgi:competence protein ComEC